jgi:hypothetical protein
MADSPHTTNPSRRIVLAGLSAAAALPALTATAGTVHPTEPGDDAELLALAAQFEPLYAEWLGLMAIQEEHRAKFNALLAPRMKARLGDTDDYTRDEYWDARWSALDEITRAGLDPHNEDLPWDDFHDRFFPVFDEIFSHLATTREGLAIQVKALLCREMSIWIDEQDEDEGDPDHDHIRTLVEGVCLVVGVQFPQFPQVTESLAAPS